MNINVFEDTCVHRIDKICTLLESKCIKRRFFKSDTCKLEVQKTWPKRKRPKPKGPKNRDINAFESGCPR